MFFLLRKVSFPRPTLNKLHWIFCVKGHKVDEATFVAADHDSSVSEPFST